MYVLVLTNNVSVCVVGAGVTYDGKGHVGWGGVGKERLGEGEGRRIKRGHLKGINPAVFDPACVTHQVKPRASCARRSHTSSLSCGEEGLF